jgi:hypothetical protein
MRAIAIVGFVMVASGSPLGSQTPVYYRGTAVNSRLRESPATLELSIFQHNDSQTVGWLKIGPPLKGSGVASVLTTEADSLYLYSVSNTGDTIVWGSATRTGSIGGRYWIRGGKYAGQGGKWRLEPAPHLPVVTLVLIAAFIAMAVWLAMAGAAVLGCDRWWKWQQARVRVNVTTAQARQWSSIGGWLGWIVVSGSILVLYLLGTAPGVSHSLRTTWMLGSALPHMRPTLLLETAAHAFQILGLALGVVLILRRSAVAPLYWTLLLVIMAVYAVYDIAAVQVWLPEFRSLFGPDAAATFEREGRKAQAQNTRLVASATVWSWYWIRSRRVRLVFAPFATTPSDAGAQPNPAPEIAPAPSAGSLDA